MTKPQMIEIARIKTGPRFRKNLGDIGELAKSIEAIGLLHPIVVDASCQLIAGQRRIEAFKLLGKEEIPVTMLDLDDLASGEIAENVVRRDFTPSESVAIWLAMESYQKTGKQLPEGWSDSDRRRDRAAEVTGLSTDTLSKAKQVVDSGDAALIEEMDATGNVRKAYRKIKRADVLEKVKLPKGKFRVIYADPPWKYGDQLTEDYGPTGFHYPSMTIQELSLMPIVDLCELDAVLFLWVTSPILFECAPVIEAWGFKYKASFVWDKIKHNMGHYNSVRHEFLLICTRGSCVPDVPELFDSVQSIERTKHSEKPEQFRTIIETLYPHGKRLELFARIKRKGWEAYGNQL